MTHYQLNDPRLQDELDRLGAATAEAWPPLDDEQLARLARLLPAQATTPVTSRAPNGTRPEREAA